MSSSENYTSASPCSSQEEKRKKDKQNCRWKKHLLPARTSNSRDILNDDFEPILSDLLGKIRHFMAYINGSSSPESNDESGVKRNRNARSSTESSSDNSNDEIAPSPASKSFVDKSENTPANATVTDPAVINSDQNKRTESATNSQYGTTVKLTKGFGSIDRTVQNDKVQIVNESSTRLVSQYNSSDLQSAVKESDDHDTMFEYTPNNSSSEKSESSEEEYLDHESGVAEFHNANSSIADSIDEECSDEETCNDETDQESVGEEYYDEEVDEESESVSVDDQQEVLENPAIEVEITHEFQQLQPVFEKDSKGTESRNKENKLKSSPSQQGSEHISIQTNNDSHHNLGPLDLSGKSRGDGSSRAEFKSESHIRIRDNSLDEIVVPNPENLSQNPNQFEVDSREKASGSGVRKYAIPRRRHCQEQNDRRDGNANSSLLMLDAETVTVNDDRSHAEDSDQLSERKFANVRSFSGEETEVLSSNLKSPSEENSNQGYRNCPNSRIGYVVENLPSTSQNQEKRSRRRYSQTSSSANSSDAADKEEPSLDLSGDVKKILMRNEEVWTRWKTLSDHILTFISTSVALRTKILNQQLDLQLLSAYKKDISYLMGSLKDFVSLCHRKFRTCKDYFQLRKDLNCHKRIITRVGDLVENFISETLDSDL